MEYTHQSSWIIPFIPLPVPILIGVGLLLFPTATKNLRRMWAFPRSGSIIHSMEAIVGYSPDKSQNMVLMGGLTKHAPITKMSFLIDLLHQNSKNSVDWYEFFINATFSRFMGERRELNPRMVDSQSTALIHLATSAL
ncbi:hypothetical protein RYX36_027773 [Vicia faba]